MTVRTRAQLNADAETYLADNAGGDITEAYVRQRVKDLADSAVMAEDGPVLSTRVISAGSGLAGGGDLSTNRELALSAPALASLAKADTALQAAAIATAAEIRAAAADKVIVADDLWLAAANVNLGNLTGTVGINFSNFLGSAKGTMTGAVTLGATSNLKVGQTFVLELLQDATGGRTLAHNATYWQTAGGAALAIDTTANALNVVVGTVLSSGKVLISLAGKKVS
ncbi:hypothetical protein [Devosia sp. 63-57]|uniref:hypothetical protein n=1 Tax=Devosia sp. 63-57 TaxID=1895751 RepID=UPI00086EDB91|nr:hypothetical protein [Devosia sp. 63-57]ODT50253.1 MAG: hypothetical protein ABS74_04875 [Pelagibacterium sp. SCN 63-126]ODU83022.1 MAG: hypothetical protein ABT14_16190 [Pelagibacterium sp. SCN 63-17]OJX44997.1 MAG: hypothetical protein BGO80_03875 [Devosia sp. 63-57]